ncbi:MAG TPA: HPr family phosphocarrier protein [Spirochaetia bacterium]|jgi:phosphocarrier protein|nr:HPr family phosphocarrier protein [Spirochaetia bacterium]
MVEKDVTVKNRAGIHARPAGMIVTLANKYASQIFLEKDNDKINAKSIMGLITLGVLCNTVVRVSATGPDEQAAVEALVKLIDNRFEE